MTLSVSHCPNCKGHIKLKAADSRTHFAYGFPTIKRRRKCLTCDFRITTIELPIDVANEIFSED